jgi:hypothetical protein
MFKTAFIVFTLFCLTPIALINFKNLNPFVALTIILYLYALFFNAPKFLRDGFYNKPTKIYFLVVLSIFVSYINMICITGKVNAWIVIWCLNYLLFFIVLEEIKSYNGILKFFKMAGLMSFLEIALLFYFFFNPQVLDGVFKDAYMGRVKEYIEGMPRIFTPGMEYLPYAVVYILSYLFLNKSKRKQNVFIYYLLLVLALFTISTIISIRTYLLGITLSLLFLIAVKINKFKIFIQLIVIVLVLVAGSLFVLPKGTKDYLVKRAIAPITNILYLKDNNLLLLEEMGNDETYGTTFYRILEATIVLTYVDKASEKLFGCMGQGYDFGEVEKNPGPHISYIGIYYVFGLFGVIMFAIFLFYFTRKIIKIYLLYKNTYYEHISTFLLLAWFNILLFAFGGGMFYSAICSAIAIVCALVIIMEKLSATQHSQFIQ